MEKSVIPRHGPSAITARHGIISAATQARAYGSNIASWFLELVVPSSRRLVVSTTLVSTSIHAYSAGSR